jgi:hypothetical protein
MQKVCQSNRIADIVTEKYTQSTQYTPVQSDSGSCEEPSHQFRHSPVVQALPMRQRCEIISHYLPLNLQQVFSTVNHYRLAGDRIVPDQEYNRIHHVFGQCQPA